jgi:hypothetical protein
LTDLADGTLSGSKLGSGSANYLNIPTTGTVHFVDSVFTTNTVTGSTISATSTLVMPSGALIDISAVGEIGEDTSDNQLVYGAGANILTYKKQLFIPVANPTAGTYLIGKSTDGITIRSIECIVDPAGAGENTVIQLQECDSTGDNCADIDSGADITADNDGATDDGSLSNPSIDSGDWFALEIVSVSGTVSQLICTVNYVITRE